jgi:hypothetical protein
LEVKGRRLIHSLSVHPGQRDDGPTWIQYQLSQLLSVAADTCSLDTAVAPPPAGVLYGMVGLNDDIPPAVCSNTWRDKSKAHPLLFRVVERQNADADGPQKVHWQSGPIRGTGVRFLLLCSAARSSVALCACSLSDASYFAVLCASCFTRCSCTM